MFNFLAVVGSSTLVTKRKRKLRNDRTLCQLNALHVPGTVNDEQKWRLRHSINRYQVGHTKEPGVLGQGVGIYTGGRCPNDGTAVRGDVLLAATLAKTKRAKTNIANNKLAIICRQTRVPRVVVEDNIAAASARAHLGVSGLL